MPFGLLDTGVGGHIKIFIVTGYQLVSGFDLCVDGALFITGYEFISGLGFCVDGAFIAGEEK